ncbi:NAD(P)H-binding protein [Microbacterium sp.]|uniref:NAD(P)H-binding protein n=1 Tax=Microbacterium sp. TaxID=51671 RepID=UPI00289CC9A5|nr:NAD(P)H-binding protein [Microbacterium sp.]
MARILIIGGHGKVALLLEPLLVAAGHHVTAVVRNADHEADVRATGAVPLVADVETFDTEQLTNLVSGNDVVIWSAGAGGGDAARTYAVDRDAAIRSIDAAVAAGVRRYVMVSYFGAGPDHGIDPDDGFYAYAEAKAAADAHLRASGLDVTIIAPSALTLDEPTGRIDTTAERSASVSRADVAAVIAAVVLEPATIGRTIRFNSGPTPIAEAIRA